MKKNSFLKMILLLLLLLLMSGAVVLNPLIRFRLALELGKPQAAQAIYAFHLSEASYPNLTREAENQLAAYARRMLNRYYEKRISFADLEAAFTALTQDRLPSDALDAYLLEAAAMESARQNLALGDESVAEGRFADAVVQYRLASLAGDDVPLKLAAAENTYRNQVLSFAIEAMDADRLQEAEEVLCEGLETLKDDADLLMALSDVNVMRETKQLDDIYRKVESLVEEKGYVDAFGFVSEQRAASPNEYALEYMEQRLRHQFEQEIYDKALAMQAEGDPLGACGLIDEALQLVVSDRLMSLRADIQSAVRFPLGEMSIYLDKSFNAQTGANPAIHQDEVLEDIQTNRYTHSFSLDGGYIDYLLDGQFSLFTGTVAFPKGESCDLYRASATLQVFGDGGLLAEFKNIDSQMAPLPFSIPVDGVRELRLIWSCQGANAWQNWGSFATIFDGELIPNGGVLSTVN